MYIYIYIYIYREREREIKQSDCYVCMYVTYMLISRLFIWEELKVQRLSF